ncbi:MAG: hypothetical protein U1F81_03340 [Verrucomicrobiaceae bacterium]
MNHDENKSSNEMEALRSELQRTRGLLDTALDRLKAQEEQTGNLWEVLAVMWERHRMAERTAAKRDPKEAVSDEESALFFGHLRVMLGMVEHEKKLRQVWEGMLAAKK